MLELDIVSLGIGVIFTVVFIALVALSFALDEVTEYYRHKNFKIKEKEMDKRKR